MPFDVSCVIRVTESPSFNKQYTIFVVLFGISSQKNIISIALPMSDYDKVRVSKLVLKGEPSK